MSLWLNLALLVFLVLLGAAAAEVVDLVGAVLLLGTLSYFVSAIWGLVGAPDVAFTEAVAGAGISSVLMLVALFHTTRRAGRPQSGPLHRIELAVVVVLGVLLLHASGSLPDFGDHGSMPNVRISTDYLERSMADTATPNVVTSILADYRGLDTLFETTVIFTAGLVCWLLLGFRERHADAPPRRRRAPG